MKNKNNCNIILMIILLCFFGTSLFSNPPSAFLKELMQQSSRINLQLKKIAELDSGKPRKNIVILGGGIAGLTAAYELGIKLKHNVK